MKRFFSILLALYMSIAVFAAKVKIGDLYYNLDVSNLTASVTYGSPSYSGDVVIPAYVTYQGMEYHVTSIGYDAFWRCWEMTSISIPNSVTNIERGAFCDCSGLTSVTIPNSVTSIGEWAFQGCRRLKNFTIPQSVTLIRERILASCDSLITIDVDANNPNFCSIDGILFTMVDFRTNNEKSIVQSMRKTAGQNINVFKTVIPYSVRATESNVACQSIFAYDKNSKIAQAYEELTKEVLEIESRERYRSRNDCVR